MTSAIFTISLFFMGRCISSRRRLLAGLGGVSVSVLLPWRAHAQTYRYDPLGRVISVVWPNGTSTTYNYDAAGNRSGVTTTASLVSSPLAAAISQTTYDGGMLFDSDVVTTVTGGVAPYTYLWERLSGNTATQAVFSTQASTGWSYQGAWSGVMKTSAWRCKVTDAAAAVVYTAEISVRMHMS